ncbi:hypothetical protein [Massilia sp. BSC265]|uniref:hypothetical protein n=1 Tax=Massilia sp. BSC265 TaxID=1549812 RepID=UPI001269908E|nr:hypothetical protein [Massilia sp. BSC265]
MSIQHIFENNPEHNSKQNQIKLSPAAVAKSKADEFAMTMKSTLGNLKAEGTVAPSAIATALILQGAKTARGGQWNTTSVLNLIRRLEALSTIEVVA